MLKVNVEKIMPVTEARDSLNRIVDEVNAGDELYVLTVNGKPSAIVVGVHHLEKLTGMPTGNIMADVNNNKPAPAMTPVGTAPAPAAAASADDLFDNTAPTNPPVAPAAADVSAASQPQDTSTDSVAYNTAAPETPAGNQFVTPGTDDLDNSTDTSAQTPTNA